MKKYLVLLLLMLNSCAIEGEVFRLQNRMNSLYQLLDDHEEQLFASNNLEALGESLDKKEITNEEFRQSLREVRINEAIMSFNGQQTAHFFYNILLRDLAKFSYEEFFHSLSNEEKISFISQNELPSYVKQKSIITKAKKHYGFRSFSDKQIINYYKQVSFPANYHPTVYETLAFLARYRSLQSFLQGDIDGSLAMFENIKQLSQSRRIPIRKQGEKDLKTWKDIKARVYMENLSDKEFLKVLASVLPQMDETVRTATINNIINRFKES